MTVDMMCAELRILGLTDVSIRDDGANWHVRATSMRTVPVHGVGGTPQEAVDAVFYAVKHPTEEKT